MMPAESWTKSSWRAFRRSQDISWPDPAVAEEIQKKLSSLPALVFADETRTLARHLAEAARGETFILQCGDCAEEFLRCTGPRIHNLLKVILQMATIIAYSAGKKVVTIGRVAGQYAKPRSSDFERVNGLELPVYRGDMVNSTQPSLLARTPDPTRMIEAYFRSVASLNLIRAFTTGGYAALERVHEWNRDFNMSPARRDRYGQLALEIEKATRFVKALGIPPALHELAETTVFASHEALVLEYEEAFTRIDTTTGKWYDSSGHFLWIGERTRQIDGAHIEFARGIHNPIGVKIGPEARAEDLLKLAEVLNPDNEQGRLTFIPRMGSRTVARTLPPLLRRFKNSGINATWICDPMHGNTTVNSQGQKTRSFDDILSEIRVFFEAHHTEGTIPAGVHLELTGDAVTECTGGTQGLLDEHLSLNYETACDPRLNAEQSIELAFEMSRFLDTKIQLP